MEYKKLNQLDLVDSIRFIIQNSCNALTCPENVSFSVDKENRTVFNIKLSSRELGELSLQYVLPEDKLVEMSKQIISDYTRVLPVQQVVLAGISFTDWYVNVFLRTFLLEIEQNFENLWDISNLVYEKANTKGKALENLTREEQTELTKEFADNRRIQAKKLFEKFLFTRNKEIHRWDSLHNIISLFYDLLLPKWQKAKSCYKQNSKHADWQKRVDKLIEVHLPPDLLKKLSVKGDNEPNFLAAQHAARICLMPKKGRFSLKDPVAFKSRIAQSRKWIQENPEQATELVKSVVKRVSRFRTQPMFRQIWENRDFFLENGVPSERIMRYLDEFFLLTKEKILSNIRGEMFLASISKLEGFKNK